MPPILPDKFTTLVDSDIPIITLSSAYQSGLSILKTIRIPEYIELYKEKESFVKLLEKLNSRVVSFEGISYFDVMAKVFGNIGKSNPPLLQNLSLGFDGNKAWGIVDEKMEQRPLLKYLLPWGVKAFLSQYFRGDLYNCRAPV
ncbi:hypothetical protein Fcan01_19226 [Folsomia candida]|uniref:Uncharacterized protein n=1 Tax=Folsomia candida TaxID=158441 RepID=A0A226DNS4_FOLCA|nr:hypothetical protein Fcan01_19226 [Folsomia candida]